MPIKYDNRIQECCFVGAIVFLFLGLGNLTFGYVKSSQYDRELKAQSISAPKNSDIDSVATSVPESVVSRQNSLLNDRLFARYSFYKVVETGGRICLGLGGVLLLGTLLFSSRLRNKRAV